MKSRRYNISFRKATDKDYSLLLSYYESTRDDIRTYATNMTYEQQSEFIKMQFEAQDKHYKKYYPDAKFQIIRASKRDVGRLYIEEWPSQIRIIDITIAPEYRGRGIGGQVMSQIIDEGASKNKAVSIHVDKDNRAMHLYERLGFKIIGGTEVYHLMSLTTDEQQRNSGPIEKVFSNSN